MKIPVGGGCACGAIRYESTAEPIVMLHCHCRDCQRASGGPFTSFVVVPAEAFKLLQGSPRFHASPSEAGGMTNVSDWKKGAKWEHLNPENEVWITGEVVECAPPKRLVLTWADPDELEDKSRLTFEIEPEGDTVRLTVTHDNFKAGSKMAGKVAKGWPLVLSSLKSFLETGKGLSAMCR